MDNKKLLPEIGIVVIVGIIFLVMSIGISYFVATSVSGGDTPEDHEKNGEETAVNFTGITYKLGEFTTNLTDEGTRRIFRVDITLELANEDAKPHLQDREPQIKDSVYSLIRRKSLGDLDEEGMQELRQDIKREINSFIPEGEVISVYFDQPLIT